jgi:hypothetical protein
MGRAPQASGADQPAEYLVVRPLPALTPGATLPGRMSDYPAGRCVADACRVRLARAGCDDAGFGSLTKEVQ